MVIFYPDLWDWLTFVFVFVAVKVFIHGFVHLAFSVTGLVHVIVVCLITRLTQNTSLWSSTEARARSPEALSTSVSVGAWFRFRFVVSFGFVSFHRFRSGFYSLPLWCVGNCYHARAQINGNFEANPDRAARVATCEPANFCLGMCKLLDDWDSLHTGLTCDVP